MRTALVSTITLALLVSGTARAHVAEGEIAMTVGEEVPVPGTPPPANAGGTAEIELTDDLAISYAVTVANLTGPATAAHIHQGSAGVPGGIVFTLTAVDAVTFQGETETLTQAQIATLLTGGYYVNVHTGANPAGEVRGQIVDLEVRQPTCSCRTLSKKDFRRCVADEIKKLDKAQAKSAEVKALRKMVKKSACGLARQPKKAPFACCLPTTDAANGAIAGSLCAPVKRDRQCTALAGTFIQSPCVPDNPCFLPASPSGAFVDG